MYSDHFLLTDDLVKHLDTVVASVDPFIESRFTGFLAISAVTVLELALKDIFLEFSARKHKLLGSFCNEYFARINGRIGLDSINGDYLKKFGKKYVDRFKKRLDILEYDTLQMKRYSVKQSFANLLTWRHTFVHTGVLLTNATYSDVKQAFLAGQEVIHCLAGCMTR